MKRLITIASVLVIREREPELKARKPGAPHPFVAGPARLNVWFDAIIALMNEKIALKS